MARVHLPVLQAPASEISSLAAAVRGRALDPAGAPGGQGAPAVAPADPLLDQFSRRVRYLRISVTDRCNYRCSYCMPEELGDQLTFQPRAALLSFEEIERITRVFARLGVRKVRLTGGEPTIRKGIVELVRR